MIRFEERLDALGADMGIVKEDLGVLTEDVRVLKNDVGVLKNEVHQLRVLYEHHDTKIGTIAEAQAHHGRQLEEQGILLREIAKKTEPLREIHDFVRRIAHDHQQRLSALEKHTGIQ